MNVIFEREISEKRRRKTFDIAKKISQSFIYNLQKAHKENDLIELIYEALRMMHKNESFDFSRKADIVLCLTSLYTSSRANLNLD
jgi:hypothetical protein